MAEPLPVLLLVVRWDAQYEEAPFDAIHVGAAAESLPRKLIEQLKVGGVMIIPVGPDGGHQVSSQAQGGRQLFKQERNRPRLTHSSWLYAGAVPLPRREVEGLGAGGGHVRCHGAHGRALRAARQGTEAVTGLVVSCVGIAAGDDVEEVRCA